MRDRQISESSHVLLSGCSGGGKSTLLNELAHRGFPTVAEPGRRIVEDELGNAGNALPWVDLAAFASRAFAVAAQDRQRAAALSGWTFFDRGLVDAALALHHATGRPVSTVLKGHPRYHRQVFLTPPWPEIYIADNTRQHGLEEARCEYKRLLTAFRDLDYDAIILPKLSIGERADFVLERLANAL